jgi:pimeloyl-ACP methyl ester carboxylesterase
VEALFANYSPVYVDRQRAGRLAMRAHLVTDVGGFLRYLEIPGEEPPILWLHGLLCASTAELAPVAVQQPLISRRSVLIDFLGYEFSDRPLDFGYSLEDHAQTIVSLLDELEVLSCYLVGHSMGGAVAALVAAQRPHAVEALIMADANLEPHKGAGSVSNSIAGQPYEQFAVGGLPGMISMQEQPAWQDPHGLTAAHLGMVRILSSHGVHRSAQSLARGTDPTVRTLLKGLSMPRFYLYSEFGVLCEAELEAKKDLESAGVEYVMVPATGHQMGLQNPKGFALKIAEAIGRTAARTAI